MRERRGRGQGQSPLQVSRLYNCVEVRHICLMHLKNYMHIFNFGLQ